jgi:hypothetical protein
VFFCVGKDRFDSRIDSKTAFYSGPSAKASVFQPGDEQGVAVKEKTAHLICDKLSITEADGNRKD